MVKDKVRWKGVISQGPASRGEVKSAFNICIIKEHLDNDYALDECKESKTTEQGWLVVGRLEPKIDSLPLFVFRWDEKDNCVDMDIKVASNTKRKREWFEKGKNGYSGHHAEPVNQASRLFVIDIFIPSKHVFKGHIHFNKLVSEEV